MTPFLSILRENSSVLICIFAMLLVILQFALLIYTLQTMRSKRHILVAVLHFMLGFTVITALMFSIWEQFLLENGEIASRSTLNVMTLSVPWLIYLMLELLSVFCLSLQIYSIRKYRKAHLSQDDIKEAMDWLPVAVCICDAEGTVLLSNLKMNALTQSITGAPLTDMHRFWQTITEHGKKQDNGYIISANDGRYYYFTQAPLILNQDSKEQRFERFIASDMTENCLIMQELSGKNKHLKEVQYRMKMVAARERSLIAAREIINARMTVHNQMGGVLLSGKYYMDHPESMDETELLHLLEYNNFFLLREAEQPEKKPDSLHDALQTAKRIGVTVKIKGTLPEHKTYRSLLAQAVEQCAANTVRHAGGNCVTVTLTEQETQYSAAFTNNGNPPEEPVKETGGLTFIRKNVERAGGTVTIESEPVFLLTVSLPKSS